MLKLTKRGVQVCLGVLWLLDGALQLQHQMFTRSFASQVLSPAAVGQPGFVSGPIHFGMHLFLHSPVVFNSLFALVQLSLGVLILRKRTLKAGLLASAVWSLIVWIFGEGYGGIFSGHTLLLMGAPGGVIIYGLLALAVLPEKAGQKKRQASYWLALVWLILWVGGGVYQLLPGQNSTADVSSMISGMSEGAPKYLASIDNYAAKTIADFGKTSTTKTAKQVDASMNMSSAQMMHMSSQPYVPIKSHPGYIFIFLLALIQFAVGALVLFKGIWRRSAITVGIILSLIFWVVGQGLGGYFTGLATDPDAGPLFVILGLAILGINNLDLELNKLGKKIERTMIGGNDAGQKTKTIKPA